MLLITGATGHVGRALVDELTRRAVKVRALTRTPDRATFPDGVEVVGGDLAAPATLPDAVTGATAVFLNPAAVGHSAAAFLALARENGVGHVVMLSSAAVRDDLARQADPLAAWHASLETEVKRSGVAWTILRASEFSSNVGSQWTPQVRYTGVVREAYGEATTAPIDERDIAAAAAQVLSSRAHDGRTYVLTGPESLTRRQMVQAVADALGRPVGFEQVTEDQALSAMVGNGLPEPVARSVLALRAASVGHEAPVTPDVARLTGGPARTFAQWAADHVAELA